MLTTMALSVLVAGAVSAQKEGMLRSYSYVEAQGGVQMTATNAPMDKLITPTAALSFGHYFTPAVGARLHVNAWQSKAGIINGEYYKWNYVTPDLDLMLNLSNIICPGKTHPLNVILLGGVGLNYAWDNDELKALNADPREVPLMWDKNRLSHNLRAGLRLETNPAKPLGLSLEVNANSLDDRFNSKTNDSDDWMFTAMLGVSFRFGHKYCQCKKAPEPAPVVKPEPKPEPKPVVVEKKTEPKPVVKTEKKAVVKQEAVKLHKEVFYQIRENTDEQPATAIKEVADFMKNHKDAKITVVGYADKGTGNAQLNKMYAQKRAQQFKDDLVKKYGCDAARISIDSKGDTVQPFAENVKNRCVIVDGTAVKEYTVYE
jgi:outer membrane protein OmpA-like peptidoglycan-associated protein